jgi:hypothetical protein
MSSEDPPAWTVGVPDAVVGACDATWHTFEQWWGVEWTRGSTHRGLRSRVKRDWRSAVGTIHDALTPYGALKPWCAAHGEEYRAVHNAVWYQAHRRKKPAVLKSAGSAR